MPMAHNQPLRRRSRSADQKPYLSHRPRDCLPTKTILQPNVKVSGSHKHMPSPKELQKHSKYLLTAQTLDSEGEIETKYLSGDIVRTRPNVDGEPGVAVQFTDMEIGVKI